LSPSEEEEEVASEPQQERLHKFLASCGVASRRAAEELIQQGRVSVDGAIITELGFKVSLEADIRLDGIRVEKPRHYYLLMNKPAGYITTMADPHATRTVLSLLPDLPYTLKPVGRLDKDTEGLLIFTNDGEFINLMTHPKFGVPKTYEVEVKGLVADEKLKKLATGVVVDGKRTLPAKVKLVARDEERDRTVFVITIEEGRNRQVRKMCLAIRHPVKRLTRVSIGSIRLKGLPKGTCRKLTEPEVASLLSSATGITRSQSRKSARDRE
jgi:23S rRNA pseudouridine2605 synthase